MVYMFVDFSSRNAGLVRYFWVEFANYELTLESI